MKRSLAAVGGVVGILLAGNLVAASREDRAGAEALVSAYTETWNRQDRGPFSIVLQEDGAFADILARFPHDPRRAAEAGARRLATRVVGFRTLGRDRFELEVEWKLDGDGGRFLHTVERKRSAYEIVATAERPGFRVATAQ
jgi:hypothetical protein